MIRKFADKMRGNSCETKMFYMGVLIIIMGFLFILGVFLVKKEQMKHIEGIDELAKEYTVLMRILMI
ncbi:MAG: hypothetical protein J6K37_00950 [Lachnospiraceae bacterium]|nr:hypothetical protein [Lachnospiraceae bacterium]